MKDGPTRATGLVVEAKAAPQNGLQSSEAQNGDLEQRMIEAQNKAMGSASAAPAAGRVGGVMGPEVQAMMAQNAKRALQMFQDPAQRKTMIAQYRAAGIEIDEEDLAP